MAMPHSKIRISKPGVLVAAQVQRRNGRTSAPHYHRDKWTALTKAVDSLPTGERYVVIDEAYAKTRRGKNLTTAAGKVLTA